MSNSQNTGDALSGTDVVNAINKLNNSGYAG